METNKIKYLKTFKGVAITRDKDGYYCNEAIVYKFPTLIGLQNYIADHLRNGTAYVNAKGNLMLCK